MAAGTIGKYERLDVLGHGTSGVVYLAWDTLLRRQVALKEIRVAGPEREKVLEEARVLDRLGNHPHIVRVNGVDSDDGVVLIDMELVRGRNLADVLRDQNGEPLAPTEAVRIVLAVLDALAYAHERRILHRDIKPANILIGADGTSIKLTDFGLAEALGTGSVAGGGGTYPYMAPEDFSEESSSDYRSDLWAVGVVLFELLTGRRPFQVAGRRADPFAWKRVIEENEAPPLRSLRPDLPPTFDPMLKRVLSKEKNARFPDARSFAAALSQAAAFLPATPVSETTPPVEGEAEPDVPFVFRNGTGAVVRTLDELLAAAARHWDEARSALTEGRIERFLRAIGEVYIADLVAELRARRGTSGDQLLREFLERARGDEDEEADPGTVPAFAAVATDTLRPRRRPRRLWRQAETPVSEKRREEPFTPPKLVLPAVPASAPALTTTGGVARWWFWPLWLLCLGPLGTALASQSYLSPGQMGQFNDVFEAWSISGVLGAMLLLVGIGARFPLPSRLACALPVAGGLVAAGALVSQSLGSHPAPDSLMRVAAVVLLPLAILLIEAATAQLLWRVWGWLILLTAFAATLHFAR